MKSGQEKNATMPKVLEKTEGCANHLGEYQEWLNCNARGKNPSTTQKTVTVHSFEAYPHLMPLSLVYLDHV